MPPQPPKPQPGQPLPLPDLETHFSAQTRTIDLVSADLGARVVGVSDEWFAEAGNLIRSGEVERRAGFFTERGAWYDGWESRRHNASPPDFAIIALPRISTSSSSSTTPSFRPILAHPEVIEISTAYFNGNHAEHISVLATTCSAPDADTQVTNPSYQAWRPLLGKRACQGNSRHAWYVESPAPSTTQEGGMQPAAADQGITHVKLEMWPDGGIARFRLHGTCTLPPPASAPGHDGGEGARTVDLAAALNGALAIDWSDQHFGRASNLLLPGRGVDMRDGWETKRSRERGHTDWVVVRLAGAGGGGGKVQKVVVDTMHFRGNFPQKVEIWGRGAGDAGGNGDQWFLLGKIDQCEKDKEHEILVTGQDGEGEGAGREEGVECTHVKMVIIPDGGVKRLRVWGRPNLSS